MPLDPGFYPFQPHSVAFPTHVSLSPQRHFSCKVMSSAVTLLVPICPSIFLQVSFTPSSARSDLHFPCNFLQNHFYPWPHTQPQLLTLLSWHFSSPILSPVNPGSATTCPSFSPGYAAMQRHGLAPWQSSARWPSWLQHCRSPSSCSQSFSSSGALKPDPASWTQSRWIRIIIYRELHSIMTFSLSLPFSECLYLPPVCLYWRNILPLFKTNFPHWTLDPSPSWFLPDLLPFLCLLASSC